MRRTLVRPPQKLILINQSYGFLVVFFLGAGLAAFFLASASRPPISVNESAALNGNWRTDDCPVVLNVTSTRRLLASRIVSRCFRDLCRSSGVSSGLFSTAALTSSSVILRCLPKALVSMLPSGTPCSTRKCLTLFPRRSERAWLYASEP